MPTELHVYKEPPGDDPPRKASGPLTVADVVDRYLAYGVKGGSPVALKENRRVLGIFRAAFGHFLPADLKPVPFKAWLKSHSETKADNTIHRWLKTIKAALNWAVKYREIDFNPVAVVTWPQGEPGRPMTWEELAAILRASEPLFRRAVLFLRCQGCRPEDFCRLEWPFFQEVVVKGKVVGLFTLSRHKTAAITRKPKILVLPDRLLKMVRWIRRHHPHERWVFVNSYGREWTPGAIQKRFRKLRERLGLAEDCVPYTTRHAQITCGLLNGNDLKTASLLACHSSVSVTAGTYAHLDDLLHLLEGANRAAKLTPPLR